MQVPTSTVPTIGYGVAWPLPGVPAPGACVPAYDYIATCTQIYLLYACMQKHYYALNVTMKRPISKNISPRFWRLQTILKIRLL